MKTYTGTKTVKATPMNRADYNTLRGWVLPADENGADDGYLVEYIDGGKPNTTQYVGYVSWSPKDQFEKAYKEVKTITRRYVCGATCTRGGDTCNGYCNNSTVPSPKTYQVALMDFGLAIAALKNGKKVAREGWNGKTMFLFLVPGSTFRVSLPPLLGIYPVGTEINYSPHIEMKTADDRVVPWLASQTDVLADDWVVID
ncbi:MAG: hypothetical protein FD135_2360 [Comamonadaceae bacterium]|nr:MAG: hypothetical protein FD135_2360 [Comamonadaceae bacterium]